MLIFTSYIAKRLLQMGNNIIDLQKNYKLPNGTVFVFEDTNKVHRDLEYITKEIKK